MQSGLTGHINRKEWRWVFIVSILFVGLSFVPYLWIFLNHTLETEWQFMGALHGHIEAAAYLSKIRQGMEGDLLIRFLHTPELYQRVMIQPIYPLLGQISRITSDILSPILVFHVTRVSVTIFMYLTLYQLAATIWMRVRSRRIFFVLVSIGSGAGWIIVILSGGQLTTALPLDLTYSHLSPFFSGLVSIHIPLAIACLALLSGIIIAIFRPGETDLPNVRNSGIVAFILGIFLVVLYPEAYLLLSISLLIVILLNWYFARKITNREIVWSLWVLVPALPFLIYYVLILRSNIYVHQWLYQRSGQVEDPIQFLISIGFMLIIGLPSIIRALRRFESDGDRYMITWLFVACVGAFLPVAIRVHFLVGVMIPVAYFATRSIEDVWLKYFQRRYRKLVFAVLVVVLMISNLVVLLLPMIPLLSSMPTNSAGLVVLQEYVIALEWLDERVTDDDIVMASPDLSIWIPLWLGSHSVTGHPYETMQFPLKQAFVKSWYRLPEDQCESNQLRRIHGLQQNYTVSFVIYGPLEKKIGAGNCLDQFTFIASFGDVDIYQVSIQFPRK